MFFNQEKEAKLKAIDKSNAVIEFDLNGNILFANDNFLNTVGYKLDEIKGQHHSIFISEVEKHSEKYKEFWRKLNEGKYDEGLYKRYGCDGREIWLRATYNPIFKGDRPYKIVKYAQDVTFDQNQKANFLGQIQAINRSQAIIEFDLKGNVLSANDNFAETMLYKESEILGKHHSVFLFTEDKEAPEYTHFWKNLAKGQLYTGVFRRKNKNGQEVWLQASYNPIFDMNNQLLKVVKYATDVTLSMKASKVLEESFVNFSDTIENNTQNATNANVIVNDTTDEVIKTNDNMRKLVNTMSEIADSAKNIAKITELLDLVAFQTNLLAINAKIEASHTRSKGFAVIANEVRDLSIKSADSSKQIKKLIDDSLRKVSEGVSMAQDIGKLSQNAAQSIKKVSTMMELIKDNAQVQNKDIQNLKRNMGTLRRF